MTALLALVLWFLPCIIGCAMWWQAIYWQRENVKLMKENNEYIRRLNEALEGRDDE